MCWVFYVNLPFGIVALILILYALEERTGEKRPIDIWGAITMVAGVTALLLGLSFGGSAYSWGAWPVIGCFAAAFIFRTCSGE